MISKKNIKAACNSSTPNIKLDKYTHIIKKTANFGEYPTNILSGARNNVKNSSRCVEQIYIRHYMIKYSSIDI